MVLRVEWENQWGHETQVVVVNQEVVCMGMPLRQQWEYDGVELGEERVQRGIRLIKLYSTIHYTVIYYDTIVVTQ